jgi:hypothetical protein
MKNGSSLKTVSLSFSLYIFPFSRDWGIECIICAIRSRKSEEELMATHILLELGKIFFVEDSYLKTNGGSFFSFLSRTAKGQEISEYERKN